MKLGLFVFLLAATSNLGFANCPDFSGTFKAENMDAVRIEQIKCSKVIFHVGDASQTYIADGKFRKVSDAHGGVDMAAASFTKSQFITEVLNEEENFVDTRVEYTPVNGNISVVATFFDKNGKPDDQKMEFLLVRQR